MGLWSVSKQSANISGLSAVCLIKVLSSSGIVNADVGGGEHAALPIRYPDGAVDGGAKQDRAHSYHVCI